MVVQENKLFIPGHKVFTIRFKKPLHGILHGICYVSTWIFATAVL